MASNGIEWVDRDEVIGLLRSEMKRRRLEYEELRNSKEDNSTLLESLHYKYLGLDLAVELISKMETGFFEEF
jgi:hypothetical protein